jgi:hypothetical protein
MDTTNAILLLVIVCLLVDRFLDKSRSMSQLDQMNKALIAKTVPEYTYDDKVELKKIKAENDLALNAKKLIDSDDHTKGRYPVT